MKVQSINAILPVDRIEPSIAFFKKIGFETESEVPEGDHLGFVILKHGETQLMYQTFTGLAADPDSLVSVKKGAPTLIYIVVDNLDAIEKALANEPITMKRRNTFYGSEEIGYREPGGHVITFAQFAKQPE